MVRILCLFFVFTGGVRWISAANVEKDQEMTGDKDVKVPESNSVDPNDIHFLLYTRNNIDIPDFLVPGNLTLLKFSHCTPGSNLKVAFHGFASSAYDKENWPWKLKDEYLHANENNSVVLVNWSKMCQKGELSAITNTYIVAKHTASLLDMLAINKYIDISEVHLIGHSLGAHAASLTANLVRTGNIARITGLDPARIIFTNFGDDYRLDAGDADMVDVIHTDGGSIGFDLPRGTVDFYPNGGNSPQPGCSTHACSHVRAPELFVESINHPGAFRACKCSDYDQYRKKKCSCEERAFMGEHAPRSANGTYYLKTFNKAPFSKDTYRKR